MPHPATKIVGWALNSGRLWKMSCDDHAHTFGGPGYWIAALEGFEDNDGRPVHPIGTLEPSEADVVLLPKDEPEDAWEDRQRALAAQAVAEGRPRAINQRRGF